MNNTEYRKAIQWLMSDDTGISSTNLLAHMLDMPLPRTDSAPSDRWDRARCIRLLELFPEWWKRIDEMSIYPHWKEQISLIIAEHERSE